jgi:hypothetical protein
LKFDISELEQMAPEEALSSEILTSTNAGPGLVDNASKHRISTPEDGKTNFDKIVEMDTSFEGINVCLYQSRETGLKVMVANVEGPIVSD